MLHSTDSGHCICYPGVTSISGGRGGGGGGGLGPHIKFGGKIWGKILPSSPNKRKNFATRRKRREKIRILGSNLKFRRKHLGYLSPIFLEEKSAALTRLSEANFGAKRPDLLIW